MYVQYSLKIKYDMKLSEILLGLFLLGYGFTSFIVIPFSFMYNILAMTLTCLRLLFESQVIALQMLAYFLMNKVTEAFLHFFCWLEKYVLFCSSKKSLNKHKFLVLKNIQSHNKRN